MRDRPSQPIIPTAVASWKDAISAFSAMPSLFAFAFALSLLSSFIQLSPPLVWGDTVVASVIQAFLLSPLAIAMHRYVLLGEVAGSYWASLGETRLRSFALFAVVLAVARLLPNIPPLIPVWPFVTQGLSFVGTIVLVIYGTRAALLFPAIATDAGAPRVSAALADAKGHTWSMLFTFAAISLPAGLWSLFWVTVTTGLFGIDFATFAEFMKSLNWTSTGFAILSNSVFPFVLTAEVAAASRLYAAYGNRLGKQPNVAPRTDMIAVPPRDTLSSPG